MIKAPPPPPKDDLRSRLQRLAARRLVLKSHAATNTRPIVSFTFDDVPVTSVTNGARVLEELGVRGTFYVSGGLCTPSGNAPSGAGFQPISAHQCVELKERGHELGCHTFTHRHMRHCAGGVLDREIELNQTYFDSLGCGIRLENFAYPYNAPTVGSKMRLQRHFDTCRGGVPGVNAGRIDLGFLRAVELWTETCETIIRNWIDEAVRQNGWLIFFSHDINEQPARWGVTPKVLEAAVRYAKEKGCDVATGADALRLVGAKPADHSNKAR
jgi:peptidoglycan/xylan/chitin deacetylase (PgdA/CDA1 family)